MPRKATNRDAAGSEASAAIDRSAVGWEYGGYYLDIPHPDHKAIYYACRYEAKTRNVRRRSLRTAVGEEAKQELVKLVAAAPAKTPEECPHPREVLTLHVLEIYLEGHATGIASEAQAIRSVEIITCYLRDEVKDLDTKVSFWTPSRQLDLARYSHETFGHSAAYIERTLSVLGAAMHDAAKVKLRLDALGQKIEGKIVSHAPSITYDRALIAKELQIAPPRKGSFVPTMQQMAAFIDSLKMKHLTRWIILALNTWARPEAVTDFEPSVQYNRVTGAIDLLPPGRHQNNKRRPVILATQGLTDWLDEWQQADIDAWHDKHGERPNHAIPLLVYKGAKVAKVKKGVKAAAEALGMLEFTQKTARTFMATHVRKMCPRVSRELRSLWLGHTVKEGSTTTEHYEQFDPEVLADVALATDFVISELQKITATRLFAVDVQLTDEEMSRIGGTPRPAKSLRDGAKTGGRDRDRTCDPYDVNVGTVLRLPVIPGKSRSSSTEQSRIMRRTK